MKFLNVLAIAALLSGTACSDDDPLFDKHDDQQPPVKASAAPDAGVATVANPPDDSTSDSPKPGKKPPVKAADTPKPVPSAPDASAPNAPDLDAGVEPDPSAADGGTESPPIADSGTEQPPVDPPPVVTPPVVEDAALARGVRDVLLAYTAVVLDHTIVTDTAAVSGDLILAQASWKVDCAGSSEEGPVFTLQRATGPVNFTKSANPDVFTDALQALCGQVSSLRGESYVVQSSDDVRSLVVGLNAQGGDCDPANLNTHVAFKRVTQPAVGVDVDLGLESSVSGQLMDTSANADCSP